MFPFMDKMLIFALMRHFFTILILSVLPLCAFAKRVKEQPLPLRDSIVAEANLHFGKKYQYAGKGPHRFDCSGFTGYVYKQFGYELAASSASQYVQGEKISIEEAQKGDLIFFKGSNSQSKGVGHVGIITEVQPNGKNTTLNFIHASVNSGVTIDSYPGSEYYKIRFIGIRSILPDANDLRPADEEQQPQEIDPKKEVVPEKKEQKGNPNPPKEEIVQKKEMVVKIDTIIHTVKRKETLFKISKTYGCTVEDLMKWNHLSGTRLKLEQPIYILRETEIEKEPEPIVEPVVEPVVPTIDTLHHKVKAQETLYRLSKMYNCTVEDIQGWNNMKNVNIRIGQDLIILKKKE